VNDATEPTDLTGAERTGRHPGWATTDETTDQTDDQTDDETGVDDLVDQEQRGWPDEPTTS